MTADALPFARRWSAAAVVEDAGGAAALVGTSGIELPVPNAWVDLPGTNEASVLRILEHEVTQKALHPKLLVPMS
eukprot:CAMPEP_0117462332 /NCGR_PEP_ID=MMETSP0784-20121206/2996_1 /TAXON_ID=39447 /ORGANISM="" /LENGTH=74 /DNA_ID=CAMNT_0005256087 /DNA_START=200 /DNA_END=425 /DNA_ORIENTATION=-